MERGCSYIQTLQLPLRTASALLHARPPSFVLFWFLHFVRRNSSFVSTPFSQSANVWKFLFQFLFSFTTITNTAKMYKKSGKSRGNMYWFCRFKQRRWLLPPNVACYTIRVVVVVVVVNAYFICLCFLFFTHWQSERGMEAVRLCTYLSNEAQMKKKWVKEWFQNKNNNWSPHSQQHFSHDNILALATHQVAASNLAATPQSLLLLLLLYFCISFYCRFLSSTLPWSVRKQNIWLCDAR